MNISVIIPTYNRVNILKGCLSSLLNQSYPKNKYEIIVVDDGSKDDTEKYVKNLQRKYKNVKYVKHLKNKGVAAARNTGIRNSKGNMISILADDYVIPNNYLTAIRNSFKNRNIKIISFSITNYKNNFISKLAQFYRDSNIFPLIYSTKTKSFFINIPIRKFIKKTELISASGAAAFKKDLFKKIGLFDEKLKTGEDTDLGYRVKKLGLNIYYNNFIQIKHIQRSNLYELMKQIFNYGISYTYLKNKNPNCNMIIPNSLINFFRDMLEVFYRPYLRIKYANSFIQALKYYPLLLLLDFSRISGMIYGYIKNDIGNNTNI